jgi:NADH:ubiquinone oxidoreductase subunit K
MVEYCEIGIVFCSTQNELIKAELVSFFALMLLPLAVFIRLSILEIIYQKFKKRVIARLKKQHEAIEYLMWRDKNDHSK